MGGCIGVAEKTMAGSYLPFAEEQGRRSTGLVHHVATMLVGFGLGCAMIYAAGGQPLAVIMPTNNMAAQVIQPAQGQFLQPLARRPSPVRDQPLAAAHGALRTAQIQAYSPF